MKRKPRVGMLLWIERCQELIAKHSTPARTRGKYKGHGSTDAVAWIQELAAELQREIKRQRGRSMAYDENMALAALTGQVLCAWYANVHRAKSYDPNRPVRHRQRAARQLERWRVELFLMTLHDQLMTRAFPAQEFNMPYGRQKRGGKFV